MKQDLSYLRLRSRRGLDPLNARRLVLPHESQSVNSRYYRLMGVAGLLLVALYLYIELA